MNPRRTPPVPPPHLPHGKALLAPDEACPECLHPGWAHYRARDDHPAGPKCIGDDCKCQVLAR
jgi:hypothetical protein